MEMAAEKEITSLLEARELVRMLREAREGWGEEDGQEEEVEEAEALDHNERGEDNRQGADKEGEGEGGEVQADMASTTRTGDAAINKLEEHEEVEEAFESNLSAIEARSEPSTVSDEANDPVTLHIRLQDLSLGCSQSIRSFREELRVGQLRLERELRQRHRGESSGNTEPKGAPIAKAAAAPRPLQRTNSSFLKETKASKARSWDAHKVRQKGHKRMRVPDSTAVPLRASLLRLTTARKAQIAQARLMRERRNGDPGHTAPELSPRSRLNRTTESAASRVSERGRFAEQEQRAHERQLRAPSAKQLAICTKLDKTPTECSRKRAELNASRRPGSPSYSPRGGAGCAASPKSQCGDSLAYFTVNEASHAWGEHWGMRGHPDGQWCGPDPEDDGEGGEAGAGTHRHQPQSVMSARSRAIAEQTKLPSCKEHADAWVERRRVMRKADADKQARAAAGEDVDGEALEPQDQQPPGRRLAMLQEHAGRVLRHERKEEAELMQLLASLPDGFRESVESMIYVLPGPSGDPKHATEWQHEAVVEEQRVLLGESRDAEASKGETPKKRVVPLEPYHIKSMDEHVQRVRNVRDERREREAQEEEARLAKNWKPRLTKPEPFTLRTARADAPRPLVTEQTTPSKGSAGTAAAAPPHKTWASQPTRFGPPELTMAQERLRDAERKALGAVAPGALLSPRAGQHPVCRGARAPNDWRAVVEQCAHGSSSHGSSHHGSSHHGSSGISSISSSTWTAKSKAGPQSESRRCLSASARAARSPKRAESPPPPPPPPPQELKLKGSLPTRAKLEAESKGGDAEDRSARALFKTKRDIARYLAEIAD